MTPPGRRRRRLALLVVWTAPSLVFLALTASVYSHFRIIVPAPLSAPARDAAMRVLRDALSRPGAGALPAPPTQPELQRRLPARGPVVATVWLDGTEIGGVDGYGETIAEATAAAAGSLLANPVILALAQADRARARLKVDVVVGRGSLGDGSVVFDHVRVPGLNDTLADILPLNPGLEGLGVAVGASEYVLLPDELVQFGLLRQARPVPMVPDLSIGLDRARADRIFARRAAMSPESWQLQPRRYFRFRTDSFVERPAGDRGAGTLALYRGLPAGPEVSAGNLRAAALAGARYLVAHLSPQGRYVYEHDLSNGHRTDPEHGGYSIPRHAGTTYFLAETYRHTRAEWLREPIERAFGHLQLLIGLGGCRGQLADGTAFACVVDRGEPIAALGSTALTVVALVEYQRATGDTRYLPLARQLAAWILFLQRADGSFVHKYDVARAAKDEAAMELYYSGEAALALARMYAVTEEPRYAQAAGRALDWLVDWYDFFLGGFFYGEEHWTCIAAEAIWPAVRRDAYRRFCDGYGQFLRDQQPAPGDHPDEDDLAGAYNTTPFIIPNNTPAGSRTEAMISAYTLDLHHGAPDPRIRDQIMAALRYLLRQQLRPENDFAAAGGDVDGGMPASTIDHTVRIDYVQHTCSAMLRGADLLEAAEP